jgi:aspartate aminotransferase
VAVVPGSAFYASGYVRLSYATSQANIEKGLTRIGEALAKLK